MSSPLNNEKIQNTPFSYFSTVYITLLSIFQSMAFAGIILSALDNKFEDGVRFDFDLITYFNCILFVAVLWHKYVNHHQIIGWQITKVDTMIIVGFGICEGLMILSLKHDPWMVHVWIALQISLGVIAYTYAEYQIKQDYVKDIFIRYYEEDGESIYYAMIGFERKSRDENIFLAYLLIIVAVIAFCAKNYKFPNDVTLTNYLSIPSIIILSYALWKWDLKQCLRKETWIKLQDFGKDIVKNKV